MMEELPRMERGVAYPLLPNSMAELQNFKQHGIVNFHIELMDTLFDIFERKIKIIHWTECEPDSLDDLKL